MNIFRGTTLVYRYPHRYKASKLRQRELSSAHAVYSRTL